MTWIQTYRGHAFSFLPDGERVYDLEDIAHALGNLCRFTGHSRRFYSVAEHSWLVGEDAVMRVHRHNSDRLEVLELLDGNVAYPSALFHDAAEAYLGDVSRPLKRLSGMEPYRELEATIEHEIRERFGLSKDPEIWKIVKESDNALLAAEREQVFADSVRPKEWEWLPAAANLTIEFLPPEVAATRWLCAARRALR